jgi:glucose-1-phosphate cytidylyltransferase
MKAVLLAGGLGTRMREETEFKPKPMVEIGGRPVLWHLMKLLSIQGINEFVILTGYKSEVIKDYFVNYWRHTTAFTVNTKSKSIRMYEEVEDWNVTVVDTGVETLTGDRLLKARNFIGEDPFFCTYADGLANVEIGALVKVRESYGGANVMTVFSPDSRFGLVQMNQGQVTNFAEKPRVSEKVNVGFFIFNSEVFDHIIPGTMLEDSALKSMALNGRLFAHPHDGFWMPMDTFREYEKLSELWKDGTAPWMKVTPDSQES